MSISDLWSKTDLCATCWKSNFAECRVRLQKTAVSKCIQIFTFMLQSMHDVHVLNGKGRQSLVVALADGWPIKGVSWVTGFSPNDGKPDMSGYLYKEDFTIEFSFLFFFLIPAPDELVTVLCCSQRWRLITDHEGQSPHLPSKVLHHLPVSGRVYLNPYAT